MELSSIPTVQSLILLLVKKNITQVVLSPGSRNAPISISLKRCGVFDCNLIHDERSAAYFALGIAQANQKPTVLVCTSGTAVLNYYPAIAEAFYQKVPLLVLTADRPAERIDQQDGQTIHQENVFEKHCLHSCTLKEDRNKDFSFYYHNLRLINRAINICLNKNSGPVHINVPLDEPLYQFSNPPIELENIQNIEEPKPCLHLSQEQKEHYQSLWKNAPSKIILVGLSHPNPQLQKQIQRLQSDSQLIILSDLTANLNHSKAIHPFDSILKKIPKNRLQELIPDLLIYIGGQVVSKEIKLFFQNHPILSQWRVSADSDYVDTFQSLTDMICIHPTDFLTYLDPVESDESSDFKKNWEKENQLISSGLIEYMKDCSFSDFSAFYQISRAIPEDYAIHFANSMAIRYGQFFSYSKNCLFFSNRGTSGIDGCTSTAIGYAKHSNKKTLLITGDTAFLYDMNALWNQYITKNFKIIVLNNQGGGIFQILNASNSVPEREELLEAKFEKEFSNISKFYGFQYYSASNKLELEQKLPLFFESSSQSILEILTFAEDNRTSFHSFFNQNT